MAVKLIEIDSYENWLLYRSKGGVGASEAATLLAMNGYQSPIELFYSKVGFSPKPFYSMRALYGQVSEELTSEMFRCWSGDINTLAYNIKSGKRIRECTKYPEFGYFVNDDCKYIFSSPDRHFVWGEKSGTVEIKDSSGMVVNNYIDKIVPAHQIQTMVQVMVSEEKYGILAYNIDRGGDYREFIYERNGIIWEDKYTGLVVTEEDYKQKVIDFWEAVILARDASEKMRKAKLDFRMDKVAEYQSIIEACEPEVDNSCAFEAYVKENFFAIDKPRIEITGTEEHEKLAEDFLKAKEDEKRAKENYQLQKNRVLDVCKTGMAIKLPGKGVIQVNQTKKGISFKVKN